MRRGSAMPPPSRAVPPPPNRVRLLADSNIVAQAVRALRAAGHDVVYVGDRTADPGDHALLAEAVADGRVFLTKDHHIGALIHRDRQPHSGVLLVDDLGDADAETRMILATIASNQDRLAARAFLRATAIGTHETEKSDRAGE
jgi:predicted nuclease of predicted toxin-antitoxin system